MSMQQRGNQERVKVLALRRPDTCVDCSVALPVGVRAVWDAEARTVRCLSCADVRPTKPPQLPFVADTQEQVEHNEPPLVDALALQPNSAGASAQREYERRSKRREEQIRSRHPKLGGLILALSNEPTSTRVWEQGARGERAVASRLDQLAGAHVEVLHDRAMRHPSGRISNANIDHLAVAASGVWVIDAKSHQGRLEVRRSGGLFSPRVERLYIAGRDKTALLQKLGNQIAAVTAALAALSAAVPVHGALCFVGTELPWFGETIGDIRLVGRRGLARLLKRPGDLAAEDRLAIAQFLANRFPPAR